MARSYSARGTAAVATATCLGLILSGCTHAGSRPVRDIQAGPSPFSSADPQPKTSQSSPTITSAGGRYAYGTVRVSVPAGAVAKGASITVQTGAIDGGTPGEVFGQPIGVTHANPLGKPLTLTWMVKGLTKQEASSLVLAKWDPVSETWAASSVVPWVSGDVITAQVQSFSVWDWIANAGQQVGEWTKTRTDPPACGGGSYPSWVEGVVNTDDDSDAAAVLSCFEPGDGTSIAAKVVNNRTFAQQLTMTGGGQDFAAESLDDLGGSVDDAVYQAAHAFLDTKTTLLIPPLGTGSVQIARPATAGDHVIQAQAQVNVKTVFADVAAWSLDQVDIGGTDNPLLDGFLQVLYKCGGEGLLDKEPGSAKEAVQYAVSTLADCADEISDPDSDIGAEYQKLLQRAIANAADDAAKDKLAKSYRLLEEARSFLKVLTVAQIAFYLSDQYANAYVGPLTLSVRGRGTPQKLGAWQPTCSSTGTDSNALYKNLALQDAFADTSKELWQFADWAPDAKVAVAPLTRCGSSYLDQLASALPGTWQDKKAAGVVASQIRALESSATATGDAQGALTQWSAAYSFLSKQTTEPSVICFTASATPGLLNSATPLTYADLADTSQWLPSLRTYLDDAATYGKLPQGHKYCILDQYSVFGPQMSWEGEDAAEQSVAMRLGLAVSDLRWNPVATWAYWNSDHTEIMQPGLDAMATAMAPVPGFTTDDTNGVVRPATEDQAAVDMEYLKPLLDWYGYQP